MSRIRIDSLQGVQRLSPSIAALPAVAQVAKELNAAPSLIYVEIKRGKLKARRIGKTLHKSEHALKNKLAEG